MCLFAEISFARKKPTLRHLLRRLAMLKVASPKRPTNFRRPRSDFTGEDVLISRKHLERGKKFFRFFGSIRVYVPTPPLFNEGGQLNLPFDKLPTYSLRRSSRLVVQ